VTWLEPGDSVATGFHTSKPHEGPQSPSQSLSPGDSRCGGRRGCALSEGFATTRRWGEPMAATEIVMLSSGRELLC
jgi:hypothetical protein